MTDLQRPVHFVGIGGVGMSGLAELMHRRGHPVSGSDLSESTTLDRLRELGIEVALGHHESQVGKASRVVCSSAIPSDNPELREARRRGIPIAKRGELLAEVMAEGPSIAIAGTHGKTTTTALVGHLMREGGLDPTVLLGGSLMGARSSGLWLGAGDWIVAESDESDGSFLLLRPSIAVVTNVDPDHLDHHGSFEALQQAFVKFCEGIEDEGAAIVCADQAGSRALISELRGRVVRYGIAEDSDLRAGGLVSNGTGMRFDVARDDRMLGSIRLPLPGAHNVANALAALAVALELGIPFATAAKALESFPGVARRFELKGEARGIQVVDDYGHHPSEIRATLAAAREAHPGRLVTLFQPHRFSRTRDCFEEFAGSFDDSDVLVVCETYSAGEAPIAGAEASRLADAIRAAGHPDTRFIAEFDEIVDVLPGELRAGDLLLTLGAGNIALLGPLLLERLESEEES